MKTLSSMDVDVSGYDAMLHDGTAAWDHYQKTGLHVTHDEIADWIAELDAGNDCAPPPACHTRRRWDSPELI